MENKTFWASVLLYNNKIKFWKLSPSKRSTVGDFYKEFIFSGQSMKEYENNPNCMVVNKKFTEGVDGTNHDIFNILAPEWFQQWELIEDYKGTSPFEPGIEDFVPVLHGVSINQLVKEVHQNAVNHGWWNNPPNFGTLISLCHSELSEALEEARKGHKENVTIFRTDDNGYTKPTGVPIELADCVIRIMDICGYYGINLEDAIYSKHEYNKTRLFKHGGKEF